MLWPSSTISLPKVVVNVDSDHCQDGIGADWFSGTCFNRLDLSGFIWIEVLNIPDPVGSDG